MGKYFGTDGIRGKVGELITPDFAHQLGHAMHVLEGDTVVIAHDTRESALDLVVKLAQGLQEVGKNVIIAGVLPTPGLAYYSLQHRLLGVMITASHNPYTDNGFKIFSSGLKLEKTIEQKVEDSLVSGQYQSSNKPGDLIEVDRHPFIEYQAFLEAKCPAQLPFSFGCDFGNGATHLVGHFLFSQLYPKNFQAFSYHPNGQNINNGVGALHPSFLVQQLQDHNLDYGFSFDGDGDRIIMTDKYGRIYDGDDILYLLALDLNEKGLLTNQKVSCTVMSNLGIIKAFERKGISSVVTDVGDSNVLAACLAEHIAIGAEASGHIMIPSLLPGGDGLLIATQLLSYLSRKGQSAADILKDVQRYAEVLINIKTTKKEVAKHPLVNQVIERIKAELHGDGKVFVRASGTEPLLRITVSAPTQAQVDRYAVELKSVIESLIHA